MSSGKGAAGVVQRAVQHVGGHERSTPEHPRHPPSQLRPRAGPGRMRILAGSTLLVFCLGAARLMLLPHALPHRGAVGTAAERDTIPQSPAGVAVMGVLEQQPPAQPAASLPLLPPPTPVPPYITSPPPDGDPGEFGPEGRLDEAAIVAQCEVRRARRVQRPPRVNSIKLRHASL